MLGLSQTAGLALPVPAQARCHWRAGLPQTVIHARAMKRCASLRIPPGLPPSLTAPQDQEATCSRVHWRRPADHAADSPSGACVRSRCYPPRSRNQHRRTSGASAPPLETVSRISDKPSKRERNGKGCISLSAAWELMEEGREHPQGAVLKPDTQISLLSRPLLSCQSQSGVGG